MEISYNTILEQSQIMSQNQIQSLQILAMDNAELNEYLMNEYLENPLLEHEGADRQEDRKANLSDSVRNETYKS